MFLIDYIVMNIDRHLRNFGIIRNVHTLKWEKVTPIFDTGECLQCNKLANEINFNDEKGKFFSNTEKKFSSLIKELNLEYYDFSKLENIDILLKEKLVEYQKYTDMSDERINLITRGLRDRIENLKKIKKI